MNEPKPEQIIDFVETRVGIDPSSGAEWIEAGGAYAMFDGVESPLTQTFGLGIFQEATAEHLETIESFSKSVELRFSMK